MPRVTGRLEVRNVGKSEYRRVETRLGRFQLGHQSPSGCRAHWNLLLLATDHLRLELGSTEVRRFYRDVEAEPGLFLTNITSR